MFINWYLFCFVYICKMNILSIFFFINFVYKFIIIWFEIIENWIYWINMIFFYKFFFIIMIVLLLVVVFYGLFLSFKWIYNVI